MKVRDLLTDETKWTKGCSARNARGESGVDPSGPTATSWCLVGAVHRCYGMDGWDPIASRIYDAFRARGQMPPQGGAGNWNDAPERTFSDVRALVEELDI